ncbi:MAG: riboflavin kinase [Patescibacteria group bacterium]
MQYVLRGKVIHGDGWGRKMGYPTANLDRRYFVHHSVPKGVWACRVKIKNQKSKIKNNELWLRGIAVIGVKNKVEVYIIDFDKNIYGWYCEAEIFKKIRSLRKYGSPRALAVQIGRDIETARRVLGKPS